MGETFLWNSLIKSLGTTLSSVEDVSILIKGIKMQEIFDPINEIKDKITD